MNAQPAVPFKVVLAVDGSDGSRAAARLVCDLPFPAGSEVTALAVLTARQTPGMAALRAALDEASALLAQPGLGVHQAIRSGHAAETLVEYVHAERPDLLVVGAHGRRSTLSILLGGVAQQLVEHVHCPVLVVRAPYTGLRRVLLATDGSAYSQLALDFLTRLPLPIGVEARVMYALAPLPDPADLVYIGHIGRSEWAPLMLSSHELEQAVGQQAETEERAGRQLLSYTVEKLRAAGLTATSILTRGDAATEIFQYLQAHPIDLIVAGSRGLGAVTGWWLGSVSRKLVHYANCSVLIVKSGPPG